MARFVEVGDGVLVGRYPQWDVNVGLVLGSDGALVVDPRGSMRQGREALVDLSPALGGLPVVAVVATHVHLDHTFGAAALGPATMYAHESLEVSLPAHRAAIRARARAVLAAGPGAAPAVVEGVHCSREEVEDILATPLRLPDVTVAESATVDLGGRLVELRHAGRGHTDGDLAVRVDDAAVAFLGDLVEESGPPAFGPDSWPLEWAGTLTRHLDVLARVPGEVVVVPGHGIPVGTDFVAAQRDTLALVAAAVVDGYAAGRPRAAVADELTGRVGLPRAGLRVAVERGYAALAAGAATGRADPGRADPAPEGPRD